MIFFRLVVHLFTQITRPRRLAGMMLLASVPGLVAWLTISNARAGSGATAYMDAVTSVSGGTLSLAILVLAVAVMRDERDGGTLPFIFLSPIGRLGFAAAAWVAAAAAAVLTAVVGWLVGFVAVGAVAGDWAAALPVLPAYVIAALAYSSVFVPLGYLSSRATLIGLGYVFVWEGILASFIPGLSSSSMWRLALSALADLTSLSPDASQFLGTVVPGLGGAVVKTAVVIALGIGVLAWAVQSRDAV